MTTCDNCDNPLPPGYKRFCSEKCRDTYHQRAYTARLRASGKQCSCGRRIFIDGDKCSRCAKLKERAQRRAACRRRKTTYANGKAKMSRRRERPRLHLPGVHRSAHRTNRPGRQRRRVAGRKDAYSRRRVALREGRVKWIR